MCHLSICIPTHGRLDVLRKTLNSIYENCSVPFSDFEVILSDNSSNDDLLALLSEFTDCPNLKYSKSVSQGYLNSIQALKLGEGRLLKLHNDYTVFLPNSLNALIEFAKFSAAQKPLIFFKNSGVSDSLQFRLFDDFIRAISFWKTWSTGVSVWRDDFLLSKNVVYNKMFPHVSLLLSLYHKSYYVIDDTIYFENQDIVSKGGYNLFRVFSVEYLDLLREAVIANIISSSTFKKIKNDLFYEYLPTWYINTKIKKNNYTFDLTNIKKSITIHFGTLGYYKLICISYLIFLKKISIRCFRFITSLSQKERSG
jgi:abequosyltransferase